MQAEYTVLITDPSGATVVCDPVEAGDPRTGQPGWTEIRLGPRRNEPGTGTVVASARPDLLAAVYAPDHRVVVLREVDGVTSVEMAGPIEVPKHTYESSRDGTDGHGTVGVTFADDLAVLGERRVYPDPTQPATNQTTVTAYTVSAVNPEDAARTLVDLNAGAGALVARRTPGLVLGTDHGILTGITVSTSFTRDVILSDAVREVLRLGAVAAGTLPRLPLMRIVPAGGQLRFEVTMPADRSGEVIFSRALGNVASSEYEPSAPVDTVAIVGDATAGVGRVVKERANSAAHTAGWRRRETWVDARGAANASELEQAGDEALADGGPKTRFVLRVVSGPSSKHQYGQHYWIGDTVSVEPYSGLFVQAVVMGADITVTPGKGEEVKPLIGLEGDQVPDVKAAELRRLTRRIAALEGAL
jgi:hypothetical protein